MIFHPVLHRLGFFYGILETSTITGQIASLFQFLHYILLVNKLIYLRFSEAPYVLFFLPLLPDALGFHFDSSIEPYVFKV